MHCDRSVSPRTGLPRRVVHVGVRFELSRELIALLGSGSLSSDLGQTLDDDARDRRADADSDMQLRNAERLEQIVLACKADDLSARR